MPKSDIDALKEGLSRFSKKYGQSPVVSKLEQNIRMGEKLDQIASKTKKK